jgi:predicted  nucleic acid-binding Zn-ribbon protein
MIMNATLKDLIRLNELVRQYEPEGCPARLHKQVNQLRAKLSTNILRRFDRLAEHGRRSAAQVSKSGACGSCHLALTPGDMMQFRNAQDQVFTCPHCGCFLYSPRAEHDESKAPAGVGS